MGASSPSRGLDHLSKFCAAFEHRRNLVVHGIRDISALTLSPPGGAFYGFIGCARLIGACTPSGTTLTDDAAIARYLLEAGHVSTVPGAAYGLSPFLRISTATSEPLPTEAVSRIAAAVGQLQLRNAA